MKFFKNPVVAFLLCLVVVAASTLASVNIRFGNKCQAVTDGFYDGVEANGYTQKALATHLKNIDAAVDGLVTIADNYGLDCSEVTQASDELKNALKYSQGSISYIYTTYTALMAKEAALDAALSQTALSERDQEGYSQYLSAIHGAQSAMESAGYNESVREFMRRNDRFPTDVLADLAGVSMPEYFA